MWAQSFMTDNCEVSKESQSLPTWVTYVGEFRTRLIKSLVCYALVCIPLIYFGAELYTLVCQAHNLNNTLIATDIISPFTIPLKLSLVVGVLVCAPFFIYQIWRFISPGLFSSEKKPIIVLITLSVFLFYLGAYLAYYWVAPMAIRFFTLMAPSNIQIMTDIDAYLNFVLSLVFSFGLAFEVPIVTFILIKCQITSVDSLKQKRPYIIVVSFILGMLLTPPDVISQICLAIPLILLFESGLWLAKVLRFEPKGHRSIVT